MTEPARWLFAIVGFPEIYGNVSPLAPELLTGQSRGDRRSVVYSLGVICYRLMTGVMPFKEEGLERIRKLLHDVPASPAHDPPRGPEGAGIHLPQGARNEARGSLREPWRVRAVASRLP